MNRTDYLPPSLIRVEKISLRGPGVVILTGPSSCGKGEVANALCELLSIDPKRHLSMGVILRTTVERAKNNAEYANLLAEKYSLSKSVSIFDCIDTSDELTEKVNRYLPELEKHFGREPGTDNADASQLEWLEFCTLRGLLIPNRWTQDLISAEIDTILKLDSTDGTDGYNSPFILDGGAAISLIDAHQPAWIEDAGERKFHLQDSINNVISTALRALGVPRVIVRDLIEGREEQSS